MKPRCSSALPPNPSAGFSMIEVLIALLILAISFAGSTKMLTMLRQVSSQNASQYGVIADMRQQLRLNSNLCTDGAADIVMPDGSVVVPTVIGCDEQAIKIGGVEVSGFTGRLSLEVTHDLLGGLVRVGGEQL